MSDFLGKRKLLAAIGYGLAAFTKPVFPLAPTVGWLIAARFIDRVGKGIRGAPRDALVADIAPAASARRKLRSAPVAGYGWSFPRTADCDCPDVGDQRPFYGRVLGRRHSRLSCVRAYRLCGAGTGTA